MKNIPHVSNDRTAMFFGMGAALFHPHRRAANLALINGAMVLRKSMLTNYPGDMYRRLSFKTYRSGDIGRRLSGTLLAVLRPGGSMRKQTSANVIRQDAERPLGDRGKGDKTWSPEEGEQGISNRIGDEDLDAAEDVEGFDEDEGEDPSKD